MTLVWIALVLTADPEPVRKEWAVDGVAREALVFRPAKTVDQSAPVIFGFHGHGGNALQASRSFHLQKEWPEALVVYMQGLPTPGRLTDPEGKRNGWQHDVTDQGGRDLKFFDVVLTTLKTDYRIDESRIYATGHSNGGGFTYLLWGARPDVFAAFAPSAATSRGIPTFQPKPVMHIAGEQDPLVKFVWQQATMTAVRRVNRCADEGHAWARQCTLYPSETGAPFVAYIHTGDHKYPQEASALIVKFFKEHSK